MLSTNGAALQMLLPRSVQQDGSLIAADPNMTGLFPIPYEVYFTHPLSEPLIGFS